MDEKIAVQYFVVLVLGLVAGVLLSRTIAPAHATSCVECIAPYDETLVFESIEETSGFEGNLDVDAESLKWSEDEAILNYSAVKNDTVLLLHFHNGQTYIKRSISAEWEDSP